MKLQHGIGKGTEGSTKLGKRKREAFVVGEDVRIKKKIREDENKEEEEKELNKEEMEERGICDGIDEEEKELFSLNPSKKLLKILAIDMNDMGKRERKVLITKDEKNEEEKNDKIKEKENNKKKEGEEKTYSDDPEMMCRVKCLICSRKAEHEIFR